MKKRVSELITVDEIKKWKNEDVICIQAGTGTGKSYFIKNILYAFAKQQHKKILYLIHRRNCIDQFQEEINKDNKSNTIDIVSYQKLESLWKYHKTFDFSSYQYIVCDEFHYFLSDAAFNKWTDISLNTILTQKDKIRIFMSATGDYMLRYINNYKHIKTKDYKLSIEFNFIKNLIFFNKDETIEEFIKECINNNKNEKGIFFIQSAEKAYNLYKKYKKYCLFNCGKSNKYYKYVDKDKINKMLVQCEFEEPILITTSCLDAGVNIVDKQVKHIICDIKDIGSLIQCIGRKRLINNKDKINLYIKSITNEQLGGMKSQLLKKIKMAKYFKDNGLQEFIKAYPKESDKNNIIYDIQTEDKDKCSKKINEMSYFKCNIDILIIDNMLKYKKYGYCKYLIKLFNYKNEQGKERYILIDENYNINLEDYLDSIVGKIMLNIQDRKELINKINLRDSRNNRLLKRIGTLNSYLQEIGLNYIIKEFETSRMIDKKKKKYKHAWKVLRLTDK